jgi:transposase
MPWTINEKKMGFLSRLRTYGVHPVQVSKWKKMLLNGAAAIFSGLRKSRRDIGWDQEAHERKIGRMAIELDYLKKKLGQLS